MRTDLRILLLDDERIVCDRLKPALEKLGHGVEAFTDSALAIERLAEQRFDVIVTDLKMPGLGGSDVLGFATERYPTTKVIVITGFATLETARQVTEKGAVHFLAKPFKISQLVQLVREIADDLPSRGPALERGATNRSG